MDRWYIDFKFLKRLDNKWISFVTRTKKNLDFTTIKERKFLGSNVIADKTVFYLDSKLEEVFWKEIRIVILEMMVIKFMNCLQTILIYFPKKFDCCIELDRE
jgi:hypothetical protein